MSGTSPQKGIPQTGIGPNVTGSQAWIAKQGLIASAPWTVLANSALSPSSFRFLLSLIVQINSLQTRVAAMRMGVTDGSPAAPGEIGEVISAELATANSVTLASGVVSDVLSLTLPPGDWDVQGGVKTTGTSGNISDIVVWVNNQPATRPATVAEINFGTGGQSGVDTRTELLSGTLRALTSQPTTVYLSCAITWTGGTCLAAGAIRARRMR